MPPCSSPVVPTAPFSQDSREWAGAREIPDCAWTEDRAVARVPDTRWATRSCPIGSLVRKFNRGISQILGAGSVPDQRDVARTMGYAFRMKIAGSFTDASLNELLLWNIVHHQYFVNFASLECIRVNSSLRRDGYHVIFLI